MRFKWLFIHSLGIYQFAKLINNYLILLAALDNESEKIVQAALDKMQEVNPRTTLVVAHRLETVKNCDKIVVLDRGGVKEEGSHSDLMDLKGLYHTLWTKQGGGH